MKNLIKIFAVVKSIELYSSETVPAKKGRWADSWSYAPPSFVINSHIALRWNLVYNLTVTNAFFLYARQDRMQKKNN